MLTHLLKQGVPRGDEGQEFSKLLPGREERTPGLWCCRIQVRSQEADCDIRRTQTQLHLLCFYMQVLVKFWYVYIIDLLAY